MTRADRIIGAITDELERRRGELDSGDTLTSVSLVLYLSRDTVQPRECVFRTEHARKIVDGRSRGQATILPRPIPDDPPLSGGGR